MSRAARSLASRIYYTTYPGAKASCAGLICRRVIDDCERVRPQVPQSWLKQSHTALSDSLWFLQWFTITIPHPRSRLSVNLLAANLLVLLAKGLEQTSNPEHEFSCVSSRQMSCDTLNQLVYWGKMRLTDDKTRDSRHIVTLRMALDLFTVPVKSFETLHFFKSLFCLETLDKKNTVKIGKYYCNLK